MALDSRRVKALFNAALDLPDPAGRPGFLERECGDDRELCERLEELLAAYDQPASALERPLAADPGETTAPDERPAVTGEGLPAGARETAGFRLASPLPGSLIGSVIAGRYKLRQEIGEGGMGSVYLADQTQPVKRHVALKLIKPGMDSRTVLTRFESERQALALMDHPNIARVLDAGATDGGRPFFVMELVKGVPLTDYCDQHRLGLPERLTLFRQICSAVQHAHQKGIIHRDLKPTNILVESHDGHPIPKVIDFGLAKATSGLQLSEHSLVTAFGTVAGTPLYMAPEQATWSALDVDTRADIYALGVILYELLTGSTPIPRETFKQAALDEILRVIREVEPPTPSSRISTSAALPTIAATRQFEPSRLGRFVRGDLDWIVMKALAKERQRRYESAIALAQDLERFTNHEPVSAGPPTATYRLRKFVRRNRPQVVAAALVLLALVAGIVGTTVGLVEARRQERRAVIESKEKENARQAEALQRRQAEKRLSQVEKANEILGSIFKDLDPHNAEKEGKPLSALLGERLDQATAQIEGEAIGDRLAVARMQQTLGECQLGLGFPAKAVGLFTTAGATFTAKLGPDHPVTLKSLSCLAEGYLYAGKYDRALPLLEETLALRKVKLGLDHPDTLMSMNNLAVGYRDTGKIDRALPLYKETLALRKAKLGPDHPDTLQSMLNLAGGYNSAGEVDPVYRLPEKRARAVSLLEETLALYKSKLGPDHPDTLTSMNNLAEGYLYTRKYDRALPLLEKTLALRRAKLGPDYRDTLQRMLNPAGGYNFAGEVDPVYQPPEKRARTVSLLEEALPLYKSKLGPGHPDTLECMHSLPGGYEEAGNFDRALPLFEETLALRKAKLGPDHPETLVSMHNLAHCYRHAGKVDQALLLDEETLALLKAKLGPDHPNTLVSMHSLAMDYRAIGNFDRALPLFEEAMALIKGKFGPDHPKTRLGMNNLVMAYETAGKFDRVLPLFEETLALQKAKFGPPHPNTLSAMNNLALRYRAAGKLDQAQPLLRELADVSKRETGADSPQYRAVLAELGLNLLQQEKWTEAGPILRDVLTLYETRIPDAWQTFNMKAKLGAALLGQKKYAAAKPLLRAGYEGMKLRAQKIPATDKARLAEALDRLIRFAEETNKPDETRMWKDERAKLPLARKPEAETQ